jgi:tRNA(Ile)-lysidine synthase
MTPSKRLQVEFDPEAARELKNTPLVLAVSGGGDSMVLLHLVHRMKKAARLLGPILVAHYHHSKLEPFATLCQQFVREQTLKLGLEYHTDTIHRSQGSAQPPKGESPEAWLASHRHRFLADCAKQLHPQAAVLTGHQAEDLAESLILALIRGAGLSGMKFPMARQRHGIWFYAPLTASRRTDLRRWLEVRSLPYMDDPGNDMPRVERSIVRRILADLSQQTQRDLIRPLTDSARALHETGLYVEQQAKIRYQQLTTSKPRTFAIRPWRKDPAILRESTLRLFLSDQAPDIRGVHRHQLGLWLLNCPLKKGRFLIPRFPMIIFAVEEGYLCVQTDPRPMLNT